MIELNRFEEGPFSPSSTSTFSFQRVRRERERETRKKGEERRGEEVFVKKEERGVWWTDVRENTVVEEWQGGSFWKEIK